jgi:hypothetical protein
MQNVYGWCSKLERLKSELTANDETERVTSIRASDVEDFMKACDIVGADCKKLGTHSVKVSHHGGSYHVNEEKVRINFK